MGCAISCETASEQQRPQAVENVATSLPVFHAYPSKMATVLNQTVLNDTNRMVRTEAAVSPAFLVSDAPHSVQSPFRAPPPPSPAPRSQQTSPNLTGLRVDSMGFSVGHGPVYSRRSIRSAARQGGSPNMSSIQMQASSLSSSGAQFSPPTVLASNLVLAAGSQSPHDRINAWLADLHCSTDASASTGR